MRPHLNQRRFRKKIYRIVFIALIAALLSTGISIYVFQRNLAINALEDELKVFSGILGNRSIAAMDFLDPQAARNNLTSARYRDTIRDVCLYDRAGALFAQYHAQGHHGLCDQQIDGSTTKHHYYTDNMMRYTTPIWDNSEKAGYISITSSMAKMNDLLLKTFATLLATSLFLLSAAYIFITRTMRHTLRPLDSLYRTALEIGKTPLSKRRATKMTDDEIGDLVDVFNRMLDTLEQENKALSQSERRFRTLAENAPIGIYLTDAEGSLLYVNQQWEKITGQAMDSNPEDYLACVSDTDREIYQSINQLSRRRRSPQVIEYRYATPITEEERVLMEYVAPLEDSDEQQSRFVGYVGSLLDVTALKEAQLELEKLAFYDPLTNLPNRRFFREHLHFTIAATERDGGKLAIIMLDMDNFKKVNDTLGHDAGDDLLANFAERMRKTMYPRDVVSRMGGDEFMILLKGIHNTADVDKISKRILANITEPFNLRDSSIELGCSLGVAIYPDDGQTPETLVRNADLALYHAKENGKNQVSYFSAMLEERIKERVYLERKLRQAHANKELKVYIQPKWDIKGQRFIGGEALLRWIDPQDGFIPPDRFIPVAEEVGLIIDIGDWVIKEVFQQVSINREAFRRVGMDSFAINLSARQFFSASLIESIKTHLATYAIPPEMIEFEITESSVMNDVNDAIMVMEQIRDLGCSLSIDDFGTGYSSLSYLKRFPINMVKIDRSFVQDIPDDPNDVEISAAIIAMSQKLGLKVTAEGVENAAQHAFLIEQQCDFIQGYYFAKPMPIPQLLNALPPIDLDPTGKA
tara:strand:- start:2348 stop:4774 length:2427 start_codon:yes stop_codon:yes gene_type:complete